LVTATAAAWAPPHRGLDVHVLDRFTAGPKPDVVAGLGGTYHADSVAEVAGKLRPDIVIDATGAGSVVFDAIAHTAAYGITCLTGVPVPGRRISIDAGAEIRQMVLENDVVVGSVNANLRHYQAAADALAKADEAWLRRLITRRVPLEDFADALTARPDDIKVVLALS
jgi:glucose 1-dehydrogenase